MWRNLIFNTLRCMPEELIMFAVYGQFPTNELVAFRLVSVWVLTIIIQLFFSRREAERNPNKWACCMIFFVTSYGI